MDQLSMQIDDVFFRQDEVEGFAAPCVADLEDVVDIAAIKRASLKIGVDPLGAVAVAY